MVLCRARPGRRGTEAHQAAKSFAARAEVASGCTGTQQAQHAENALGGRIEHALSDGSPMKTSPTIAAWE
jgi:hypothetical protein